MKTQNTHTLFTPHTRTQHATKNTYLKTTSRWHTKNTQTKQNPAHTTTQITHTHTLKNTTRQALCTHKTIPKVACKLYTTQNNLK